MFQGVKISETYLEFNNVDVLTGPTDNIKYSSAEHSEIYSLLSHHFNVFFFLIKYDVKLI